MNQTIEAPTSFLSFKKLSSAPTIPKKMVFPDTSASASASNDTTRYGTATATATGTPTITTSNNTADYATIAVVLGVVYMMFNF